MPEWSYDEVTAEWTAMGFTHPTDADFTNEEVDAEMRKHRPDQLRKTVAQIHGSEWSPEVVASFARLAKTMGRNVKVTADVWGWNAVREITAQESFDLAMQRLKSNLLTSQRDKARARLDKLAAHRIIAQPEDPYAKADEIPHVRATYADITTPSRVNQPGDEASEMLTTPSEV